MTFYFAFLEFLGTTEMLVIAVVALIVFGPRKLPEIGRTVGKSLAEFKRASEDFKRTWEREVEIDRIERDLHIDLDADLAGKQPAVIATPALGSGAANESEARTIARGPASDDGNAELNWNETAQEGVEGQSTETSPERPRKHDWL